MAQRLLIRPNAYRDSVTLMALTQKISELPGVTSCVVAMATEMNKELLQGVGLLTPVAAGAGVNDLVVAVAAAAAAPAPPPTPPWPPPRRPCRRLPPPAEAAPPRRPAACPPPWRRRPAPTWR